MLIGNRVWIKFVIQYQGGFKRINTKGEDQPTTAKYKFTLKVKRNATFANTAAFVLDSDKLHTGNFNNAVAWEHIFDLEKFKPFEDFQLIIERKTSETGPA